MSNKAQQVPFQAFGLVLALAVIGAFMAGTLIGAVFQEEKQCGACLTQLSLCANDYAACYKANYIQKDVNGKPVIDYKIDLENIPWKEK